MRMVMVEAASRESVLGLHNALAGFEPELVTTKDGRHRVTIELGVSDRATVRVLHAVEEYVSNRGTSTRVELDGHRYTLHSAT